MSNIKLSTTESVDGFEVVENLGLIFASTARAKNIGSDFIASIRNVFGGEINEYTQLLGASRAQSIDRLKDEARKIGADAVIGVRLETSTITQGVAEIVAYGTAVKLKG